MCKILPEDFYIEPSEELAINDSFSNLSGKVVG